MSLRNQVAIITGASSGIGLGVARELDSAGMKLVSTELQDHFEVHPREMLKMQQPLEPQDIARCVRFMLEQPPHVSIPKMMILPSEQAM